MDTKEYKISIDAPVTPKEILAVREEPLSNEDLWQKCLEQSLCVATARDVKTSELVGVGFIVGNLRHGILADLVVHSAARQNGVGGKILDALVSHAKALGITYISLTYDKSSPWLKEFYARHGFRSVDFAMWEHECLAALGE